MNKNTFARAVFEDVIFTSLDELYNVIVRDSDIFNLLMCSINDYESGSLTLNLKVLIHYNKNTSNGYVELTNDFYLDSVQCS